MRGRGKLLAIAVLTAAAALFSGCSGLSEIEELIVVSGAAIDYDGREYTVTAEIIDLQRGSQETAYKTFYLESKGESISQAVSRMSRTTGKELYWGHASVFIISRDVAQNSLVPVLEWFLHDTLAAFSSMVVLANTEKASEIYNFVSPTENSVSFALEKIMTNYSSREEKGSAAVFEMIDKCGAQGVATLIPVISGVRSGDETVIAIDGLAVFASERLSGIYGPEDSEFLRMLLGSHSENVMSVDTGKETVHFHCGKIKTDRKAFCEDGRLRIELKLEVELKIVDVDGNAGELDEAFMKRFSKAAEEYLVCEGRRVVGIDMEDFGSDVLGIGQLLERTKPKLWDEIKDGWRDIYKGGELDIEVRTSVGQSGEASKTLTLASE
ncbi:MAG: Ger(x)C family spore germination protein [Eubacteriales bacterium]